MSVCMQVWFLQVPMPSLMPFLLLWAWLVGASSRPGPRAGSRGAEGHCGATRAQASALDAVRVAHHGATGQSHPPVWTPTSGDGDLVGTPTAGQQLDSDAPYL